MKIEILNRSFKIARVASVVAVALTGICSSKMSANTIALDFTGGELVVTLADATYGWAFTLSGPVLLTDLGVWDGPQDQLTGSTGDGLAQSHMVTIWTSTGTFVTSAVVPSGTSGTLVDDFRYISVAPTLLAAGSYVIGGFYQNQNAEDTLAVVATTITTAAGVTYNDSRSQFGNVFPTGDLNHLSNSYFGPNFQFIAPTNGSVPEGGNTVLLLIGAVAPLVMLRRVLARKSAWLLPG